MKTKVKERFSEFFEDEYLQHMQRASEDYLAKSGCENKVRRGEGREGNGEATSGCSRQEDGEIDKVGGLSEEWGASEAGGGTGAGGTERSNGGTREGDERTDCVRLRTLKGVLDVLNPLQCAEFLAGISMLQIQLRQ
ncbi:hypothetical protein GH714_014047 [Hevea brasiliensis]|uniref:Uncharacterized protein n=1 Tax=Hevea brasiliensis TaxID=3981 RepID=A0A6A6LNY5_HEVBR|nr:hypothetical protein GH714_014047 [Hevea brasiliensis]